MPKTTKTKPETLTDSYTTFLSGCDALHDALIATGRWAAAAGRNRWEVTEVATGKTVTVMYAYEKERGWVR